MAKDVIIDVDKFNSYGRGFLALEDTSNAPLGSLRIMRNARITDRGGLAPRQGTRLLGEHNATGSSIRGLYNFKLSAEQDEVLVKAYDDELEVYSRENAASGWFRLKNLLTTGKEFGFVHSLVNTENKDYLLMGNRFDPTMKWQGRVTLLNGALAGAETAVTVDSTLEADVYDSQTASGSSATTLTVPTSIWAASQWIGFYVRITSGVHANKVRLISATTATQITFATLGSDPGSCTFEIRRLAFPASGTIIYNDTAIAYSAIDNDTQFTVASAHAAPDNTPLTLSPENVLAAPRGNRFTNYLGRTIVGAVRSALSRDSGGTLQGFAAGASYFVSKISNPFDYGYSGTRLAGEGDLAATPYGGGDIVDVVAQEDTAYIFKRDYIESVKYSQDANDLAVREPLKSGVGSVGKTTKASDDIYFFTPDKQFTSIGRVVRKDIKPQTQNIGNKIKRYLDSVGVDDVGRGIEVGGKLYIPIKGSVDSAANDTVLVYNRNKDIFEGLWDVGAFGLAEFAEKYYYAESTGCDVYELFHTEYADVIDADNRFPISFEVATHFFNLTPSKMYTQAMRGVLFEGYIRGGTVITYNLWKDFTSTPFLTFNFAADSETGLLDGDSSSIFLGDEPLGLSGLEATYGDVDADGRRHFMFRVYFPFQYGNYFAAGIQSSGLDYDHETTRIGLILSENPMHNVNKIKAV